MNRYNPPNDSAGKRAYDQQWEREKAAENFGARKYDPPNWKKEADKRAYDQQWEREKAKRDYRK